MNSTMSPPSSAQPSGAPMMPSAPVPHEAKFDERRLRRELSRDAMVRWGSLTLLLMLVLLGAVLRVQWMAFDLGIVLLAVVWIVMNMASVRVGQQLGHIAMLVDHHPAQAELAIRMNLRKWTLQRSVRLLLYHRLALVRHRQHRHSESARIARAILAEDSGSIARVRPHLLLVLGESYLYCGDLLSTHAVLLELHGTPLQFQESLQLLALQTRYEVAAGHNRHALWNLEAKLDMAEMLSSTQCGILHALFALAATREQQPQLADWLNRRARLLCTSRQLEAIEDAKSTVLALA